MRPVVPRLLLPTLLLTALFASACAGDDDAPADAGADGAADGSAPAVAAPPTLTPCPPGWAETPRASGLVTCDPWPEGSPECGPDEAWFPGASGCATVGAACPAGDFSDALPADAVVLFVLPGVAGGDGSRGNPFGVIPEAMAVATPGTVIALAKGTQTGQVRIRPGVTLWGACAGETTLTARLFATGPVVAAAGMDAVARDLRISGGPLRGAESARATSLALEGVIIDGVTGIGLFVTEGGTVTGRDLVVRDVQPVPATMVSGHGVNVLEGGRMELRRSVVELARAVAIFGSGVGTELVLEEVAIRDTQPEVASERYGRGLSLDGGAQASARRSVFERNFDVGAYAIDEGTTASLEDVLIRDTSAQVSDGEFGHGVGLELGPAFSLRRVVLDGNQDIGLFASHGPTSIALEDVAVLHTRPDAVADRYGRGVNIQLGATGTLARTWIEDSFGVGLLGGGSLTDIRATDLTVLDTHVEACAASTCAETAYGFGIAMSSAAVADVSAFSLRRSEVCGLQVATEAQIDLMRGEVVDARIGACVQIDGYDFDRLTSEVSYRDNEVNLDTTTLPVPDVSGV